MVTQKDKVTIVVINYNGEKYIDNCIRSYLSSVQQTYAMELIVIDNSSTDRSIEIANQFKVMIVKLAKNFGASVARQIGARLATSSSFILFSDNDVIVHPEMLERLLAFIRTDSKIGGVSPRMLSYDKYPQIPSVRKFDVSQVTITGELFPTVAKTDGPLDVNYLHGPLLMVRTSIFADNKVHFDTRFLVYYEDVDFSLQLVAKGYKLCVVPSAIFWHQSQGSAGRYFHTLASLNKLLSFRKNLSDDYFKRIFLFLILGDLLMVLMMHFPKVVPMLSALRQRAASYIFFMRYERINRLSSVLSREEQIRLLKSLLVTTQTANGRAAIILKLVRPIAIKLLGLSTDKSK